MTKTMKKSLVAVLVLVMAFACGMFAMNVPVAKAEKSAGTTDFEDYVTNNLVLSEYTEAKIFGTDGYIKKVKEAQDLYGDADDTEISDSVKAIYNSVIAVVTQPFAIAEYSEDTLYNGIMTITPFRYSQYTEFTKKKAQLAEYDETSNPEVYAWFKTSKAYSRTADADGNVGVAQNFAKAEEMFTAIKDRIDSAISKIKNIQVFKDGTMVAFSTLDENDTYRVVLDSQESIGWKFDATNRKGVEEDIENSATKALNAIYGESFAALTSEHATIKEGEKDYYTIYKALIEKLNAEYAKIAETLTLIDAIKDLTQDNVWTNSYKVTAARTSYGALLSSAANGISEGISTGVNHNDLQSVVDDFDYNDYITAKEGLIKTVDNLIKVAISAINVLPDAIVYTSSLTAIETAETAVKALPKDVKGIAADEEDVDDAVLVEYVMNIKKLRDARAAYNALVREVNDVISAIKGLKSYAEADDKNAFYRKYLEVNEAYNICIKKTGDQEDDVNKASIVSGDGDDSDWPTNAPTTVKNGDRIYNLVTYYQSVAANLKKKINDTAAAIKNISETVELTEDYLAQYNEVKSKVEDLVKERLYDFLDEKSKEKFDGIKEGLKNQTDSAKEWSDAVDLISDTIIVDLNVEDVDGKIGNGGWKAINNAIAKFNAIGNATVQNSLRTLSDYSEKWTKYEKAIATMERQKTAIKAVADKMAAIAPGGVEYDGNANFDKDIVAYSKAISDAKTEYEKITTVGGTDYISGADNYIQNNETEKTTDESMTYKQAYTNYTNAQVNSKQYAVESEIAKIVDNPVALTSETQINKAREEFNKLDTDTQKAVRNSKKLTDAEKDFADLTSQYNNWINAVIQLVDKDSESFKAEDFTNGVAGLKKVNFATVSDLYGQYDEFIKNDGDNSVVNYLAAGKTLLDSVNARGFSLVKGLFDAIDTLDGKADNDLNSEGFTMDKFKDLSDIENSYQELDATQIDAKYDVLNKAESNTITIGEESYGYIAALNYIYAKFTVLYQYQNISNSFMTSVDELYKAVVLNPITVQVMDREESDITNDYIIYVDIRLYTQDTKALANAISTIRANMIHLEIPAPAVTSELYINDGLQALKNVIMDIAGYYWCEFDWENFDLPEGAVPEDYYTLLDFILATIEYYDGIANEYADETKGYFENYINAQLEYLKNDVADNSDALDSLQTSVETINGQITKINAELAKVDGKITEALKSYTTTEDLKGLYATKVELESQKTALEGQIKKLSDAIGKINKGWDLKEDETIKSKVESMITEATKLIGTWTEGSKLSGTLASNIENLASQLSGITNKDTGYLAQLAAQLKNIVNGYTDEEGNHVNGLNELTNMITGDDGINAKIAALTTRVSTLESSVSTLTTDLANLTDRVSTLEGQINGYDIENEDGTKTHVNGLVENVNNITERLATVEGTIGKKDDTADKDTIYGNINKVDGKVDSTKNELQGNIDSTKSDLNSTITANDKAINELLNSKVAQLNKTITIITVIFSVVMAGMIACTVILFLKKK